MTLLTARQQSTVQQQSQLQQLCTILPHDSRMPDLTPTLNHLLTEKHAAKTIPSRESRLPSTKTADEFLKEAYRIVSHLHYS